MFRAALESCLSALELSLAVPKLSLAVSKLILAVLKSGLAVVELGLAKEILYSFSIKESTDYQVIKKFIDIFRNIIVLFWYITIDYIFPFIVGKSFFILAP